MMEEVCEHLMEPDEALALFRWRKQVARQLTAKAIESGELKRARYCSQCGAMFNIHAHHEDYQKPLSVEWLCAHCHSVRHQLTVKSEQDVADGACPCGSIICGLHADYSKGQHFFVPIDDDEALRFLRRYRNEKNADVN